MEAILPKADWRRSQEPKIIQVFLNSDLRASHNGLDLVAKKNNVETELIEDGQFLVFINRSKTMFKIFAANNTLVFHKSRSGMIDLRAIEELPKVFRSTHTIDFQAALKKVLLKEFEKKRQVKKVS